MTRLPLLTTLLAAGLMLGACGSDSSTASDTTAASVSASTSPSVTSPPTEPTGPTTPATPAAPSPCLAQHLEGAVKPDPNGASAGHFHYVITLSLKPRATSCTLAGFPRLTYVSTTDDKHIGAPATHDGTAGSAVTLAPGTSATIALTVTDPFVYTPQQCRKHPVGGYLLTPPAGGQPVVFLAQRGIACSNPKAPQLLVGPFTAG